MYCTVRTVYSLWIIHNKYTVLLIMKATSYFSMCTYIPFVHGIGTKAKSSKVALEHIIILYDLAEIKQ